MVDSQSDQPRAKSVEPYPVLLFEEDGLFDKTKPLSWLYVPITFSPPSFKCHSNATHAEKMCTSQANVHHFGSDMRDGRERRKG